MIYALLLAAFSWGQEVSTPTYNAIEQIQFQNLAKDVRELQSGRPTITGLPTFQDGIKFGDGTTQTTAPLAFVSTHTVLPLTDSAMTQTAHNACVAGSTITLTTVGGDVIVSFIGQVQNSAGTSISAGFLQDGAHVSPWTAAIPPALLRPAANIEANLHYTFRVRGVSAGSHSYCVTVAEASDGGTLYCDTARCYFEARETHNY